MSPVLEDIAPVKERGISKVKTNDNVPLGESFFDSSSDQKNQHLSRVKTGLFSKKHASVEKKQVVLEEGKSRSIEQDERYLMMKKTEDAWQGQVNRFDKSIPIQEKSIKRQEDDIPKFIGKKGIEKSIENAKLYLKNSKTVRAQRDEDLKHSATLIDSFKENEELGRQHELSGDLDKAQEHYNKAQRAYINMQERNEAVFGKLVTKEYKEGIGEAQDLLMKTDSRLKSGIKLAKTSRNVAIVVGATAVTGGAALAAGGTLAAAGAGTTTVAVGSVSSGVAAGTAFGATTGTASAGAENWGHVKLGNKTKEQAVQDFNETSIDLTRQSAIAASATFVGGPVGKLVTTGGKYVKGAVIGGTSSGVNTVANTSIDIHQSRNQAKEEFTKLIEGQDLSNEEKKKLYIQYLDQKGLSTEDLLKTSAVDVATSIAAGAVGGRFGASSPAGNAAGKVFNVGAETGIDAGIGVTSAAVKAKIAGEDLSREKIIEEVGNAMIGTAVGHVSAKVEPSQKKARLAKEASLKKKAVEVEKKVKQDEVKVKVKKDVIIRENLSKYTEKGILLKTTPPLGLPEGGVQIDVVKKPEINKKTGEPWEKASYTYSPEKLKLKDLKLSPKTQEAVEIKFGEDWADVNIESIEQYYHNDPENKYSDNWRVNIRAAKSRKKQMKMGAAATGGGDVEFGSVESLECHGLSNNRAKALHSEWDGALVLEAEQRTREQKDLLDRGHFINNEGMTQEMVDRLNLNYKKDGE